LSECPSLGPILSKDVNEPFRNRNGNIQDREKRSIDRNFAEPVTDWLPVINTRCGAAARRMQMHSGEIAVAKIKQKEITS